MSERPGYHRDTGLCSYCHEYPCDGSTDSCPWLLDEGVEWLHRRVNAVACEVLGHDRKWHTATHRGETFRWAYCHRCGEDRHGQSPGFEWVMEQFDKNAQRFSALNCNAVIVGLTDAAIGGME